MVVWDDNVRDTAIEERLARNTGLALGCGGSAFSVLTNRPNDLIAFPDGSGAVIGKLFHRHGPSAQLTTLSRDDADALRSSQCRRLIDRYWGGYVAIVRSHDGVHVLRDPSGALPAYYLKSRGNTIVASDADLLLDAGLLVPDIDWSVLGGSLYLPDIPMSRTSLAGVSDLRAGTMLSLASTHHRVQELWSPWDHIGHNRDEHVDANATRLRHVVQSCISAWASCYRRPLIGVSGGLDSSIVAASLATTAAEITCLTMSTEDPVGDERDFARAIASHIGAPLIENRYEFADVDISRSATAHLPRPCGRSQALAYNAAILRATRANSNDAVFSGNGGDNVLYLTHSARPLVDRYLAEGFSPALAATIGDIASITNASVWQIIAEARRVWRKRATKYQWHREPEFLSADFVRDSSHASTDHPWLTAIDHAPPGKRAHVAMLVRMQLHLEGRERASNVPTINPLASQPVMEVCLSIPSWQFCTGGTDRAIARAAFSKELPPLILNRKSKGGPEGFVAQIVNGHLSAIRSRLLEGRLVAQGFLDRTALATALASGQHKTLDYSRIVSLLDTEAWLARWLSATRAGGRDAAIMP
jgi:asparagine synthase (glutamine-hydrolysing)